MHELAVCQSLLHEVERVAAAHNSTEVTRIVVAVGPLSGVEALLLARAFDVASAGSVAGRAALEIEEMPVVVWCNACRSETSTATNALLCGRCGTWQVDLKSGNELLLKRVELAGTANSAVTASC